MRVRPEVLRRLARVSGSELNQIQPTELPADLLEYVAERERIARTDVYWTLDFAFEEADESRSCVRDMHEV
jgi:hypothetical protein